MFRRPSFNRRHRIAQNSSPYRRKRSPLRSSGASPHSPHARPSSRVFDTDRPDVKPRRTPRDFAKHNVAFDTQPVHSIDKEESDSDDSIFHWEEEATLLSDLMEDGPLQPDDQVLDQLADSLQDSFTLKGRHMKREIAETLVGTHNHVKVIYHLLDETIDPSFGRGVSLFNKACKTLEQTVQLEQIDFESAYKATQEKIQLLFEELKSEYQARDKLWAGLNKSIDDIVTSAIEGVKDAPARVERTIVKLEKHDKSLGNTSTDMETVTKTLQQLLKAA